MSDQKIHTVYKLSNGTRVPSVTTYLSVLAKPALIHWAWNLGVQGLDYQKVRDQAGDIGTLVHYLILCKLKGEEPALSTYTPQDIELASVPMGKFEDWYGEHSVEPIIMEEPMVSEVYKFGGTMDFYGKVDNKLTLLDFKTSGAIYMENFFQLAAYRQLLFEYAYTIEDIKILRVGKNEDEGFEVRAAGNLDKHWEIFLACQKIYELQKEVRKS
uniref:PD-(D/E)XK nuclease superfamily protein n=1 Tax=viral metagenome TaxID=1070528 RepID=A0A6M3KWU2_9ZZZZ